MSSNQNDGKFIVEPLDAISQPSNIKEAPIAKSLELNTEEIGKLRKLLTALQPMIEKPFSGDEIKGLKELLASRQPDKNAGVASGISIEDLPAFPTAEETVQAVIPQAPEADKTATATAALSDSSAVSQISVLENARKELLESWNKSITRQKPAEVEINHLAFIRKICEAIEIKMFFQVFAAVAGVFPIQNSLRNGTTNEKKFATIAAGDRFLLNISGLVFEERKNLVKSIARYLTDISAEIGFVSHEGANFDNQNYEKVDGSASTGKIREIHGYVVINKSTNQVYRSGRALL